MIVGSVSRAASLLLLAAVGVQGCTSATPPTAPGAAGAVPATTTALDPAAASFVAAPAARPSSMVVGKALSPAGPLVEAAVSVLAVTGDEVLGTTSTDAQGNFVAPAGNLPPSTPVRIEVTGSTAAGEAPVTVRSLAVTLAAPEGASFAASSPAAYRVAQASPSSADDPLSNQKPAITNIEPKNAGAGQKVLVTGAGFSKVSRWQSSGADKFRVLNDSQATCIVKDNGFEFHYREIIRAYDAAGNSTSTRSGNWYYVATLPGIERVSPSHLSSTGGEEITIYGSGFVKRKVKFTAQLRMNTDAGATSVPLTNVRIIDDTQIKAVTPRSPGGAGPADVLLVTDADVGNSSIGFSNVVVLKGGDAVEGITFFEPPTLTGIAPVVGSPAGGDAFTLTGAGFNERTKVKIQGQVVTDLTFVDSHTLRGKTPRSTALGASDVVVESGDKTPSLLTATLKGAFVYNDVVPSVSQVSPASGPMAGGTAITITGANFDAGTTVTIGGKALVNPKWVDAKTITGSTPAGAAGSQDVAASANGKQYTFKGGFTYNATTCPSGQVMGKNGCEAVPAIVVDASSTVAYTVMAPILNSLQSVSGKNGVAAFEKSPAYKNLLAAVSTALASSSHSDMAGYLRWAAKYADYRPLPNFVADVLKNDATVVRALSTVMSDVNTQVRASGKTLPPDATTSITLGSTSISLTSGVSTSSGSGSSGGGSSSSTPAVAAPTIASVSSATRPTAGGNVVTITGTNLTGATSVTFGGAAGTALTVDSATQLTVTAPAGTGTVDVAVTTPGGTVTSTGGYAYAPTLTSVSPAKGSTAGSQSVTLTGTGFTGATSVTFGGVAGTALTVVSATSITVSTPAGTGTVDVVVTTPAGSATSTAAYEYVPPPTISAISPQSGSYPGGDPVVITGTGLDKVTSVTFGGDAATINSQTATSLNVTPPDGAKFLAGGPGAPGGGQVEVVVTSPDGTATTTFTYTEL